MNIVREADRLEAGAAPDAGGPLDLSPLLGDWVNTYTGSGGIVRVLLTAGGGLTVRAFGAGPAGPVDWGEVPAETLYADGLRSRRGMAFTARYDFGFMQIHLQANQNLGLLVVAGFNRFTDGSGRSDYFSREFYHR